MPSSTETPNSSNNLEEKIEIKFLGFKISVQNPRSKPFIVVLTVVVLLFLCAVMLLLPTSLLRELFK